MYSSVYVHEHVHVHEVLTFNTTYIKKLIRIFLFPGLCLDYEFSESIPYRQW